MEGKIIRLHGNPLSGIRILLIETKEGFIVPIYGDHRPMNQLIENLGTETEVKVLEEGLETYIIPIR